MYYGATKRREGLRALLSVAAIAAGLVLSNIATSSTLYLEKETVDVVGLWQRVAPGETSQASTPLFEIRRAADGDLEAIVMNAGGASSGPWTLKSLEVQTHTDQPATAA